MIMRSSRRWLPRRMGSLADIFLTHTHTFFFGFSLVLPKRHAVPKQKHLFVFNSNAIINWTANGWKQSAPPTRGKLPKRWSEENVALPVGHESWIMHGKHTIAQTQPHASTIGESLAPNLIIHSPVRLCCWWLRLTEACSPFARLRFHWRGPVPTPVPTDLHSWM